MVPRPALVRRRSRLAPGVYAYELAAPALARRVKPGQFVGVGLGDPARFPLRRPLSVADAGRGRVLLVLRVVGPGTAALCRVQPGATWDLLGPLGKPVRRPAGRRVLVVGGGLGLAPLHFLVRRLARSNTTFALLGARTRAELVLAEGFHRCCSATWFATEDGTRGRRGLVTDLVPEACARFDPEVVYAAGPVGLLARVDELCADRPTWGFLESRLGCGTGICYGCAVRLRRGGYARLCTDGPVFDLREVELEM